MIQNRLSKILKKYSNSSFNSKKAEITLSPDSLGIIKDSWNEFKLSYGDLSLIMLTEEQENNGIQVVFDKKNSRFESIVDGIRALKHVLQLDFIAKGLPSIFLTVIFFKF